MDMDGHCIYSLRGPATGGPGRDRPRATLLFVYKILKFQNLKLKKRKEVLKEKKERKGKKGKKGKRKKREKEQALDTYKF